MLEIKLIGLTAALVVAIAILLNHDISKDYQKKRPPYEKDAILLEPGDNSHSESGEKSHSESSNKNQSPGLCLLN